MRKYFSFRLTPDISGELVQWCVRQFGETNGQREGNGRWTWFIGEGSYHNPSKSRTRVIVEIANQEDASLFNSQHIQAINKQIKENK